MVIIPSSFTFKFEVFLLFCSTTIYSIIVDVNGLSTTTWGNACIRVVVSDENFSSEWKLVIEIPIYYDFKQIKSIPTVILLQ